MGKLLSLTGTLLILLLLMQCAQKYSKTQPAENTKPEYYGKDDQYDDENNDYDNEDEKEYDNDDIDNDIKKNKDIPKKIKKATGTRLVVLNLLKKYSPSGYHIVDTYRNSPSSFSFMGTRIKMSQTDFMVYVRGNEKKDILKSLNTVVHETCHGYTSRMVYVILSRKNMKPRGSYSAFYLGKGETVLVKQTKVFPSRKIHRYFPAKLKKGRLNFRFKTYIYPNASPILGTQRSGIYGLLDEFNAYYHGTKTAFDMMRYYKKHMENTDKTWFKYLQSVYGTYYAYAEFKLFILTYLLYAKNNYPGVYRDIMNNRAFIKVFIKVDKNYSRLIKEFFKVRKGIFSMLRKKGYTVSDSDRFTRIGKGYMRRGIGNFISRYRAYMKEINRYKFRQMMRLINKN